MARIAPIAEEQWGLVSRQQAEAAGIARATIDRLVANGLLHREGRGVYRVAGAPPPDNVELRAAWLGLDPSVPTWERTGREAAVSHRSAARVYDVGDLPADRHEFTLTRRRQSRRSDIRLHFAPDGLEGWVERRAGLPVTRPARIASDLLQEWEVPDDVARIVGDSLNARYEHPWTFAQALAPHAAKFNWLRPGDGLHCLQWLLELDGSRDAPLWMEQARDRAARASVA